MNILKTAVRLKLGLNNPYKIKQQFKLLNPKNSSINATLFETQQINHNSHIFRFALPSQDKCLGHMIGQYIQMQINDEKRKYVPISRIDENGIADFLIRDMRKDNGSSSFTSKIMNLKIGQQIKINGPFQQFLYHGYGKFSNKTLPEKKYKHVGLIAFQTGITTFYSLIDSLMPNYDNETAISLLWVGSKFQDFMFLDQFSILSAHLKINFNLMLSENVPGWIGPYGKINESYINDFMPPPTDETIILLSGGQKDMLHLSTLLTNLGYRDIILPEQS